MLYGFGLFYAMCEHPPVAPFAACGTVLYPTERWEFGTMCASITQKINRDSSGRASS